MAERGITFERGPGGETQAMILGPVTDVHMHPRIFDPRFYGRAIHEPNGKAGIHMYSQAAVRNGINMGLIMPNESVRMPNPEAVDGTELVPFPITTPDRVLAASSVIIQRSLMRTGLIMGVDPEILRLSDGGSFTTEHIRKSFSNRHVLDYTGALKVYGNDTTGGYNIPLEAIVPVAGVWHEHNPTKPVILHLEDEAVGLVLSEWPRDIPVHIAHVSSQQELEPVMAAIDEGKDVTCEATPHHLFLTEQTRAELGPIGCMKPSLKKPEDVKFLWDNIEYIQIFASDCAPHRLQDKFWPDGTPLASPAYGITNHDVYMATFLSAVYEGKLSEHGLYDRIVTNPIRRFGLPFNDIYSRYSMVETTADELSTWTEYGHSPFGRSSETPPLRGKLMSAYRSGSFLVTALGKKPLVQAAPGYQNLIRF